MSGIVMGQEVQFSLWGQMFQGVVVKKAQDVAEFNDIVTVKLLLDSREVFISGHKDMFELVEPRFSLLTNPPTLP